MRLYSCDVCGKTLDPETDPCFAWKVEGGPVVTDEEPTVLEGDESESDSDSVDAMDLLLAAREDRETVQDEDDEDVDGVGETVEMMPASLRRSFDVCGGCYTKLIHDPLGLEARKARPFSRN